MANHQTTKQRHSGKALKIGAHIVLTFALLFQMAPAAHAQGYSGQLINVSLLDRLGQVLAFDFDGILSRDETIEPEAVVEEPEPPTVQETLLAVCETNGYGEDCARTLLGMLWTESSNRSDVIGDRGRARGYFQIHYRLHNISAECAEDLVCSAQWTLDYLEYNHYPTYTQYAVQCHNSCNAGNGYTSKVARYANYFWDQPLEVSQSAPVVLPQPVQMI